MTTNFCFPIKELSSSKVKLTPFDVSNPQPPTSNSTSNNQIQPVKHATPYFTGSIGHPSLYQYMSIGPFTTEADFITRFLAGKVNQTDSMACFAIIDKTKPASPEDPSGQLAGMVSYMSASAVHLSAEVGYIIILPPFQRTHVTTHAVGLLLQYALDSPEQGGLGLRRMQWLADPPNTASLTAAKRMGFQEEGILRWNRVVDDADARGKVHNGRDGPRYGKKEDRGRDTVYLSICWDDWEEGGREKVESLMTR